MTKLLRIDFHYERVYKKYETAPDADSVLLLMRRARKLYQAIEKIMTIIKLIERLKSLQQKETYDVLLENLRKRIRSQIKSFLHQHTLFPIQFKFDGVDLLQQLKNPGN